MMISLKEIMTTEPVTLAPGDPVARVGELMREHKIRHIPIVKKNKELVGLITQRDILAAASSDDSLDVASDLMRKKVHSIAEDADMRSAAIMMQKHKIGCLPVVRDKKLIGIVTDSDYVSLAINLLEQLEMAESEDFDDGFDDGFDDFEESSELQSSQY